jgi:hypothetical protein
MGINDPTRIHVPCGAQPAAIDSDGDRSPEGKLARKKRYAFQVMPDFQKANTRLMRKMRSRVNKDQTEPVMFKADGHSSTTGNTVAL